MKRHIIFILTLLFLLPLVAMGRSKGASVVDTAFTYRGTFYCAETRVSLVLDLYEASLEVPGYAFLGPSHGYMRGDTDGCLYGVWMLTSFRLKGDVAVLRLSNDLGSDAQEVELTPLPDGTLRYRARGTNAVRKAVGRKLVKLPAEMVFRRK